MDALVGQPSQLELNVQVIRKETGLVENYKLVGFLMNSESKELDHGGSALDTSKECGN